MIFTFVIFVLSATHIADSLLLIIGNPTIEIIPHTGIVISDGKPTIVVNPQTGIVISDGNPTIVVNPQTGIVISDADDTPTFGEERCKNCTDHVNKGFVSVKPLILTYDNQNTTGLGTCTYCTVTGINTLKPYGDSCVSYVQNNMNLTITRVFLKLDQYTMKCYCTFSNALTELQANLSGFLVPNSGCGTDVNSAVDIGGGTGQGVTDLGGLTDPTTLESCQQLNSPGSTETVVTETRYNLTFFIDIRNDKTIKGPKATSVVNVKVIERDFKNIHVSCVSEISTEVCNCVLGTQVFKVAIDDIETFVLNCALKNATNTQLRDGLDAYVMCAKYF